MLTEDDLFRALKRYTEYLAKELLFILIVLIVINLIYNVSPLGRDDSDEPGWFGKRSGIRVHVDYATGCEYFEAERGGLTPRLSTDGKHYGCNQ